MVKVSPGGSMVCAPFLSKDVSKDMSMDMPLHPGGWGDPTTPDMNGLKTGQGMKAGHKGFWQFCMNKVAGKVRTYSE